MSGVYVDIMRTEQSRMRRQAVCVYIYIYIACYTVYILVFKYNNNNNNNNNNNGIMAQLGNIWLAGIDAGYSPLADESLSILCTSGIRRIHFLTYLLTD